MGIISGLTNQTIDTIYSVAKDGWSTGTSTTVYNNVPCRWQEIIGKVLTSDQEEKTYKVEVWIETNYTISYGYEFKKGTETYKVVLISKKFDLDGIHDHTKVFLE